MKVEVIAPSFDPERYAHLIHMACNSTMSEGDKNKRIKHLCLEMYESGIAIGSGNEDWHMK